MRTRPGGLLGLVVGVLALTGCGTADAPRLMGEQVPQGSLWCGVLTDAEVAERVGEQGRDLVSQFGALDRPDDVPENCSVMWNGEPLATVADLTMVLEARSGPATLENFAAFLGDGGARVTSGEVTELSEGIYLDEAQGWVMVGIDCRAAGAEQSRPATGWLSYERDADKELPGGDWSRQTLDGIGDRVFAATEHAFECATPTRGLTPADVAEIRSRPAGS